MPTRLAILGAGNITREMLYASAEARDGQFEPTAFVVDPEYLVQPEVEGLQVLPMDALERLHGEGAHFLVGIGEPTVRRRMIEHLRERVPGVRFATVVHRSAIVMPGTRIGEGVYVAPNTTLAIACRLGDHVVLNQNAALGHDCEIGENSVISPGCILSGRTRLGPDVFLGSAVVTYPRVELGEGCSVSAGVVVSRNLPARHKLILKPNTMVLPPG